MSAIFKREFRSYFTTPVGFVVLAIYYFFLGLYFSMLYSYGSPDVPSVVMAMSTVVMFTIPVLTMRLMSEDRRQKVDQALLTAPVRLSGIVFGKFFAALAVFAIGFAPSVIFEIIVACLVKVNVLAYLYALFGILLLGGESSFIAAFLSLIVNILVLYMSSLASIVKVSWIATLMQKAAFISVFESFGDEVFSVADVVYFVSIIAAFLFLSIRSLEKRRWA